MIIFAVKAEAPEKEETIIDLEITDTDLFLVAEGSLYHHKPKVYASKSSLYSLIEMYDWDARLMYAIMMAESGGNTNAVNKEDNHRSCKGSYGLFQIGCLHFGKYGINYANWNYPSTNIKAAYEIYKVQGLRAWGVYTNGSYKRFY